MLTGPATEFILGIRKAYPKASDIRLKLEQRTTLIKAIVHVQKDMYIYDVPDALQSNWISMLDELLPHRPRIEQGRNGDTEYEDLCEIAFEDAEGEEKTARFRASLSTHIRGEELVLRMMSDDIPSPDSILLPERLVEYFVGLEEGLVLFVGQTGSGKTTSMASLVKHRAERRSQAVVTLEDPVEYIYPNVVGSSEITHRQVGKNTKSFHAGLKAAMRQRPDVIVIGEIRDRLSASTGLSAGMSGHVVIGSLHATWAFQGAQRLYSWIDNEESGMQGPIGLEVISSTLKAVIAQRLVKNVNTGKLVAVHEILLINDAISNLIRAGSFTDIRREIESGQKEGMQSFEVAIKRRVEEGLLPPQALVGIKKA